MQFKVLAFSALAATAIASQEEKRQTTAPAINTASVLSILETAIPPSLLSEALTNPAAVTSQVESEFSANSPPAWFTGLPSNVQSYLTAEASATTPLSSIAANITASPNATAIGHNSSAIAASQSSILSSGALANSSLQSLASMTASATGGSASGTSGSGSGSSASAGGATAASSSGGASIPTAIMGAGLAGMVGMVGLFAL